MNGNIRKRNDNKYQFTVTLGTDTNGQPKRYYKTVKAKSYEDAKVKLAIFYNDCLNNRVARASGIKFKDFISIWEEDYAKLRYKKSTYISNMRSLKRNFDMFNEMRLNKIKTLHIRKWLIYLQKERGLSGKTIKNNYNLLRCVLKMAVMWEYIDSNPAKNVELPKVERKEAKYYSKKEVAKLIDVLNNTEDKYINYKVGILIALFGGLRKGEVLGLDEEDVDFDLCSIKIRQSRMIYGTGGPYIDSPKTLSSVRSITLPKEIIEEIRTLLAYQQKQKRLRGDVWQESKALLKNEVGNPLYPQSLYRWFIKLQKENNLPRLSLHGLRHTHVSMLRDCGFGLEIVSKRVGHSEKKTTLNIYSHVFSQNDNLISKTLSEQFLS